MTVSLTKIRHLADLPDPFGERRLAIHLPVVDLSGLSTADRARRVDVTYNGFTPTAMTLQQAERLYCALGDEIAELRARLSTDAWLAPQPAEPDDEALTAEFAAAVSEGGNELRAAEAVRNANPRKDCA